MQPYQKNIINRFSNLIIGITILLVSGCTAHYPVNEHITNIKKSEGYRIELVHKSPDRSESLLIVVAFSGGGTRAAAFSYGVMEVLRDVKINWEGSERRLLDEVDIISSVSGGSFPAAYYGLFGDRIFEDFEEKFLKADVQGHLKGSFLNPFNWFVLGSPSYGRSDYAADYYDEILFEGKTFGDILKREDAPLIQINATEVSTGTQFTFVQNTFDLLCADLSAFPVSRAVAASSAVPVILSSITINNYAGTCGFEFAPQAKAALDNPNRFSRRNHLLEKYVKYLDSDTYPYLHLYDGGLTDNLGIRPGMNRFAVAGDAWEFAKERKIRDMKRLVFIVVNAQAESKTGYSKQASPVPLFASITGATSIPLNEYTFESLVTLKVIMNEFKDQITAGRCADKEYLNTNDCADFKDYLIYVDLDQLPDKEQRERLKQLPTSFVLQPEEVDELRQAAKSVLLNSKEFQQLLNDSK
jgi:NTE family protein